MEKILDEIVLKMKDEMLQEISNVIKFRSVQGEPEPGAPFGTGVKNALDYVLELGEKCGFKSKNIDNYAGHVEFGTEGKLFDVLGHLDVVPEGTGWSVDPYEGVIKDGYLWGRGAIDDKGPIVAALFALKALKEMGVKPKGRIRIVFGTNEESGWKGVDHYFKHEEMPEWGVTPDGDFPIIYAEKGVADFKISAFRKADENSILISMKGGEAPNMVASSAEAVLKMKDGKIPEKLKNHTPSNGAKIDLDLDGDLLRIVVTGKSAHGAKPSEGKNAIEALVEALLKVDLKEDGLEEKLNLINSKIGFETDGKSMGISGKDDVSGPLTVNFGKMEITDEKIELIINIRYPIFFNVKMVKSQIEEALGGMKVESGHGHDPLYVSPDSELVKLLSEVYEDTTGEKTELIAIGGGTYARAIPNAAAFGPLFPGREATEHQPDERISVEDLMMVARVYAQLLYRVATTG